MRGGGVGHGDAHRYDQDPVGGWPWSARRDDRQATDHSGLAVSVDTVQNGAELDATKITFKPGDLKTAQAAQAAMHPEQVKLQAAREKLIATQAENRRRMSLIGQ